MKIKEGYVYSHTTLGSCLVLSILQEHGGNKMVVAFTDKKGLCVVEYYTFNKRVQSGQAVKDDSYALISLDKEYKRKGSETMATAKSVFKDPVSGVYYVSYKCENENISQFCSCYEFTNTFVEI